MPLCIPSTVTTELKWQLDRERAIESIVILEWIFTLLLASVGAMWTFEITIDFDRFSRQTSRFQFHNWPGWDGLLAHYWNRTAPEKRVRSKSHCVLLTSRFRLRSIVAKVFDFRLWFDYRLFTIHCLKILRVAERLIRAWRSYGIMSYAVAVMYSNHYMWLGTVENHDKKWWKTRRTFVKIAKITAVYIAPNLLKLVVSNSQNTYHDDVTVTYSASK